MAVRPGSWRKLQNTLPRVENHLGQRGLGLALGGVAAVNKKIYITGGWNGIKVLETGYTFDP